ncbi:RNA polymerase-associated protein RTF1 homolog [Clavelina lepadiformis]|uniref:RNA polymerase-associated protein RTF1 homolog n=1 Tax=Clavelina lepadiformis TaxID=159417 RepID=UPI00404383A3
MNRKRKNPDFSGSDKTKSEGFAQVGHLPAAKRPKIGITSTKPKMLTSKSKSVDEKALKAKQSTNISRPSSPSILPNPSDRCRIIKKKNGNNNRIVDNLKVERQPLNNKVVKQKLQVSDVYSHNDEDEMPVTRSRSALMVSRSSDSGFDEEVAHTSDKDGRANNVKRQPLLSMDELSTIRLSRFKLENWIHFPIFKETVLGCYVRVWVGEDESRPPYVMAEIVDVVQTVKSYQFGKVRTNVGLMLKHGQHKRIFTLQCMSNSDFTDSEFLKWKQAMEEAGERLPSFDDITKKQAAVNKVQSCISKLMFEKIQINFALRKTDLLKQRRLAQWRRDAAEVDRLTKLLDDLKERPTHSAQSKTETFSRGQLHLQGRMKSVSQNREQIIETKVQ